MPSKEILGLDVGTMNLVLTTSKQSSVLRNVFLKVNLDEIEISNISSISYIRDEETNSAYIIGEDAINVANIFGLKVSRPMKQGMLSPEQIDGADIMTMMFSFLIGEKIIQSASNVICGYSVPGSPVDSTKSTIYHTKVIERMLTTLGFKDPIPVNEGLAIVYDSLQDTGYTGIGISFGAGMTNVCVCYKGVPAVSFSTSASGDWIDEMVADSLGMVPNRVTLIKERSFDLSKDFYQYPDRKTRRVVEALHYYYRSMLSYTCNHILRKFEKDVDIDLDEPVTIVVAGGTSSVPGFIDLFRSVLAEKEFPFQIKEVRPATSLLLSVSRGIWKKLTIEHKEEEPAKEPMEKEGD
jgi:hypothetical protein